MANVFLVIGNGWSALSAVSTAVSLGARVQWIQGSGMRMISPLPSSPSGIAAHEWAQLAAIAGIPMNSPEEGSFTREFRNKSFREPKWVSPPQADRVEALPEEMLWPVEARFASSWEARFESDLFKLEEEIREVLLQSPQVRVVAPNPVTRASFDGDAGVSVELGSGETIQGDWLIFADRLLDFRAVHGMPATLEVGGKKQKVLDLLRKWGTTGVLQVVFGHGHAIGETVDEGFLTALQKEAGQEDERHVWGYFSANSSVWTTGLAPEENEDNHQIAKRLRRIKQSLSRAFDDPQWKGDAKDFLATVTEESVRFLDGFLFVEGTPVRAPMTSKGNERLFVLTDGFGIGPAMEQAAALAESLGRPRLESIESQAADHPEEPLSDEDSTGESGSDFQASEAQRGSEAEI